MKPSTFQLITKPKLEKLEFEVNSLFRTEGDVELDIKNSIDIARYSNNIATVKLNISIFEHLENTPFKLSISISGNFKWNDELGDNQDFLNILLKENAPAILYSHIRPIVSLITMEANIPPLTLPLMNFKNN